ncbi:uncharacterized protein CLUP02_08782 [Colletotrichum lupini]|uniref:Uncharacterized protein n=1 Tax=Colletotrichum lupini TaxID=145971 RepID=A0A9Q8WGY4_9PEZI|nr:uncharacterized protein CLUP02_08782 [Colletotrichum lupini]UQC83288.1 hypothetical protein CLUP02_08782 [Colletotrichum lupini]
MHFIEKNRLPSTSLLVYIRASKEGLFRYNRGCLAEPSATALLPTIQSPEALQSQLLRSTSFTRSLGTRELQIKCKQRATNDLRVGYGHRPRPGAETLTQGRSNHPSASSWIYAVDYLPRLSLSEANRCRSGNTSDCRQLKLGRYFANHDVQFLASPITSVREVTTEHAPLRLVPENRLVGFRGPQDGHFDASAPLPFKFEFLFPSQPSTPLRVADSSHDDEGELEKLNSADPNPECVTGNSMQRPIVNHALGPCRCRQNVTPAGHAPRIIPIYPLPISELAASEEQLLLKSENRSAGCQLGSLESSLLYPPSRSLQYCLWSTSSDTGTIIVGLNVLSNGPESFTYGQRRPDHISAISPSHSTFEFQAGTLNLLAPESSKPATTESMRPVHTYAMSNHGTSPVKEMPGQPSHGFPSDKNAEDLHLHVQHEHIICSLTGSPGKHTLQCPTFEFVECSPSSLLPYYTTLPIGIPPLHSSECENQAVKKSPQGQLKLTSQAEYEVRAIMNGRYPYRLHSGYEASIGSRAHDLEASFCRVTFSNFPKKQGASCLYDWHARHTLYIRKLLDTLPSKVVWIFGTIQDVVLSARATTKTKKKSRPLYYLPRTVWSIFCITIVTIIIFGGTLLKRDHNHDPRISIQWTTGVSLTRHRAGTDGACIERPTTASMNQTFCSRLLLGLRCHNQAGPAVHRTHSKARIHKALFRRSSSTITGLLGTEHTEGLRFKSGLDHPLGDWFSGIMTA